MVSYHQTCFSPSCPSKYNSILLDAQAKNCDAIPDPIDKFYLSYLRNFQNLTTSYHPHIDAYLSTTSGSQTCLWLTLNQPPGQVLSFLKLWLSGAPSPSCITTRRNLPDPAPLQVLGKPSQREVIPSASPPEHKALILSSMQVPTYLMGFQLQRMSPGSPLVFPRQILHDTKTHAKT